MSLPPNRSAHFLDRVAQPVKDGHNALDVPNPAHDVVTQNVVPRCVCQHHHSNHLERIRSTTNSFSNS